MLPPPRKPNAPTLPPARKQRTIRQALVAPPPRKTAANLDLFGEIVPKWEPQQKKDKELQGRFDALEVDEKWRLEWLGMPEFISEDKMPWATLKIHLRNWDDMQKLAAMLGQKVTAETKYLWWPAPAIRKTAHLRYKSDNPLQPKHPVYIISKGRHESRLTAKALDFMAVPYWMVIEEQEYDLYAAVIDPARILVLPPDFKENYDTFSDTGKNGNNTGPGAARNWCWEHSISQGASMHWVMDDNILNFWRFNNNIRIRVGDGSGLRACEDFVERYENIAISGPQYYMFCKDQAKWPAYVTNTRIYSCLLIRNDIPYRWRGRYNEDTDLSLRALKDGWCTVQFNFFLQQKVATQLVKGGNSAEFYDKEGTLNKSKMLVEMHPDVARVLERWGRWHHYVDYTGFKQELVRKTGLVIPAGTNDYGMKVVQIKDKE